MGVMVKWWSPGLHAELPPSEEPEDTLQYSEGYVEEDERRG